MAAAITLPAVSRAGSPPHANSTDTVVLASNAFVVPSLMEVHSGLDERAVISLVSGKPEASSVGRGWTSSVAAIFMHPSIPVMRGVPTPIRMATPSETMGFHLAHPTQLAMRVERRLDAGVAHPDTWMLAPRNMPIEMGWDRGTRNLHLHLLPGAVASVAADLLPGDPARAPFAPRFALAQPRDPVPAFGRALAHELSTPYPLGALYADTIVHALLAYLLRRSPGSRRPYGLAPYALHTVLAFLHDQHMHDLSLPDLAALIHLSPYHFLRQFKRSTGLPPHQYLLRLRLARAADLLRYSTLSGTAIAHAVGFSDQSQLVHHFRRSYGTTPSVWRVPPPASPSLPPADRDSSPN